MAEQRSLTSLEFKRRHVEAALALMTGKDFPSEAGALLDALGYPSDRTIPDQTGDPADFLADAPDTQPKRSLIAEAGSIRLLRQVTDAEIAASARDEQADALFCGGDLYEGERARQDTAAFLRREFAELAPIRVYLAPGNHDYYGPDSIYSTQE